MELYKNGAYLLNGRDLFPEENKATAQAGIGRPLDRESARQGTIAWNILQSHNTSGNPKKLKIRYDALTSHDLTYVGIIQTARASGMDHFPMPYVLTCCHNSLCAVGGTINEDDHLFGLTAAKKYGGIYVPPHVAVIHQYMRERHAGCGKMILGSDSHTRYGALGTMAVGEGGGELDKQILGDTDYPEVVAVYLTGRPQPWVGPQDIALALCRAVFQNGYVKNKVMEFVGPGVSSMTTDYRNAVDVMTTETTCLSSIWRTDEDTRTFLQEHGREEEYRELNPGPVAYYDGCITLDLSTVKPMIALPFHPSNAYTIDELNANLEDILRETEKKAAEVARGRASYTLTDKIRDGKLQVQQGVIGGCSGGNYSNVAEAAALLRGRSMGRGEFALNVYPSSLPVYMDLMKKGMLGDLMAAGAVVKTAFCGPCFGAGDTPGNNGLFIRHNTWNFPNREGSKPGQGQMAAVALMDARSIAATAANGGILTSAEEFADVFGKVPAYHFDDSAYKARVYDGFGKPEPEEKLFYGPNIKDWPEMPALGDNVLLQVCSKILDPVTTTDELIPSGETSSYRSNPLGLAEFTLSRRDPEYVGRTKAVKELELAREAGKDLPELAEVLEQIQVLPGSPNLANTEIGSLVYATRPGDGSAREQAASCQRVIGGLANITQDYATKRYRSNVINWGMLPLHLKGEPADFEVGAWIYLPEIRKALEGDLENIRGYVVKKVSPVAIDLYCKPLTQEEKNIILDGCLINYNRKKR
ncbi:hydratase [uncultured Acidaminococcus sp.]|uniref:hydratase n=1 Tax=uncultured Acidaminococcus sp. TaxID=352152 RepID=UPI002598B349|nr:hydratase [uncultured Acidaminococcus sp.]